VSVPAVGGGSVLDAIVARARERVAVGRDLVSIEELRGRAEGRSARRSLRAALTRPGEVRVIAEHKRRSPSRGPIQEGLAPGEVGRAYVSAGAAAISVLTEPDWFGGSLEHLGEIRSVVDVPVLRKEFIVDPWQVWEAASAGADALLLIVSALDDRDLVALLAETSEAGLEALVEVHDATELDRAIGAGAQVVGVNNRNLKTLAVSLDVSLALVESIPDDVVAVSESGLRVGEDLARLVQAGFDGFLVGESLMSSGDPGGALARLLADAAGRLEVRS
jgi:indole-3-glycerol phosphate synthase